MKRAGQIFLFIALLCIGFHAFSQDVSFIALGDLHYDRIEDHDMDYVKTRPQDLKQIMEEYPQYTSIYMSKFLHLIKNQTLAIAPSIKAVVQLGDLVEGVAGNLALAKKMDQGAVDLLNSVDLSVPWILIKGNHDVSNSPGQPEAWNEVIRPFIEDQVKKKIGNGMYTFKISDQVELFILDQFFSVDQNLPESEMVSFLETAFTKSTATYKFVLTHQPVIPITERCWHLLSGIRRPVQDSTLRNRFLNLLGKNKAIVLCAHLHQYSVLSRQTPYGPVVQIMVNSVISGFDSPALRKTETEYKGGEWVKSNPDWQPFNQEIRFRILEEEKKHVNSFFKSDLPGYCILSIHPKAQNVMMEYYNGFSVKPFQTINITDLQHSMQNKNR